MPPVVVLDSNVFISFLLKSPSSRALIAEWRRGSFEAAISTSLLRELRRVLKRPKFQKRISHEDIEELITFINETALFVHPITLRDRICRDKTDDKVFACAFAAGATCVVSGDKDVLTAGPIGGLLVCSPRDFLAWLKRRHPT